ncbi:hypothetical protein HNR12_002183 [Streptomonospora nanhaiensis]|uniref:Uncharacterized protein n=1 Tax=Streptomonospora nanhaiensis TaxID=1323731 RepID=A0A853BMT6_9ACTN|nr:hypothetical protein [Streptomonospora nanhaiensis]NYI95906.1 hypothetical protein [Streptomonospora nanhaiensis]
MPTTDTTETAVISVDDTDFEKAARADDADLPDGWVQLVIPGMEDL